MPDIYGAPLGIMAVDQDQRDHAQSMMTLAQGAQKLEIGQMELQKQRGLMQALSQRGLIGNQSGGASGLPGATQHDLAGDLFAYADAAISSGNWEEATKAADSASKLLTDSSTIQKATFDSNVKRLNIMSNLMGGVYDEATWRRANAEYQAEMGEPSPYAKYPFNPDLVEKIKGGAISAKDKAYVQNQEATARYHDAETKKQAFEIRKISAETKKIQDQDALILKNGGKPPTNVELEPVSDMISSDYGKAVTKEQARTLARPIYSRALEIMDKEGKTKLEAMNQAYEEAKSGGGLKNLTPEAKPKDKATGIIDDILGQMDVADEARGTGSNAAERFVRRLPVTGIGGYARRFDETILDNLGISDETGAKQFKSSMQTLRTMAPKLITGSARSAKDEREMTRDIVPGLEVGSSKQATRKALHKLRDLLNGTQGTSAASSPSKPRQDNSKFVVGQTYRNPKGQTAIYKGDGNWEEQ